MLPTFKGLLQEGPEGAQKGFSSKVEIQGKCQEFKLNVVGI